MKPIKWKRDLKQKWRRDLTQLKEGIIEQLVEGPKRWSELWDQRVFSSTRHLKNSLKELIEENWIVRIQYSHKNVVYMLSSDFEIYAKTTYLNRKKLEAQKEAINEIRQLKGKLTNLDEKAWISTFLLHCLGVFLLALEHWVRTPKNFESYVKNVLIESMLDNFGSLLSTFGQTYPDSTDSSLAIVKLMIWELMNNPALKDHIFQKADFIDFDIQQAEEEKRELLTRKPKIQQ